MQLFYRADLAQKNFVLDEEESKHIVRVLRLENGDHLLLTDGKGKRCEARITDAHPKRCALEIIAEQTEEQRDHLFLHLAIAPTKNLDRMEWFTEKAVEIGIDEISFLDCEHSERTNLKTERIEKIAVAAMKQSMRNWLPQLNDLTGFTKFLEQTKNFDGQKFIAHCHSSPKLALQQILQPQSRTLILIGPEGDFSEAEVKAAEAAGFIAVDLGPSRLRTETAALVACMMANLAR